MWTKPMCGKLINFCLLCEYVTADEQKKEET